jgi:DNA-binding response OmpR family regulator
LVVDDEPLMQFALAQDLERAGHQVEAVSDGREALEALGSRPFDFMILDLKLPDMSGLDVLQSSRQMMPGLHVVMISACATALDQRAALAAGTVRFMEKPFPLAELRALIADLEASSEGTQAC